MELLNTTGNRHDLSMNRTANRSLYNGNNLSLHRTTANQQKALFSEFSISLGKTVNFVSFSPFDSSCDILAAGTKDRVAVFRLVQDEATAPQQTADVKVDYHFILDYITGSKANTIAFSPKTDFSHGPEKLLSFAVAGDDFCILILSQLFTENSDSTLEEQNSEQQYISGHNDYINDMAFEPLTGQALASTSDDCTCCIWSLPSIADAQKNEPDRKLLLTSPGISVKWHNAEPNKLFVAEKAGIIRFYDTNSGAAVMFFECNRTPLMSSDWCNNNSFYIGCCAGKDLFFWDTSLTSLPIRVVKTNAEGLSDFAFFDNAVVAYRGRPKNFLKVLNVNTNQVLIEKEFVAGRGLGWCRKLSILAVGGSKGVHVYKLNTL